MNVLFLKNGDGRPLEPVRRDWFAADTGPPSPVFFTAVQAAYAPDSCVKALSAPADKVVPGIRPGR